MQEESACLWCSQKVHIIVLHVKEGQGLAQPDVCWLCNSLALHCFFVGLVHSQ